LGGIFGPPQQSDFAAAALDNSGLFYPINACAFSPR
jgi:hypothetical protein